MSKAVAEARADFKKNGISDPFDALEKSDADYRVEEASDATHDAFDSLEGSQGGIVYWDPDTGLEVSDSATTDGKGGIASPAQCLLHEGRHAAASDADPSGYASRANQADPNMGMPKSGEP